MMEIPQLLNVFAQPLLEKGVVFADSFSFEEDIADWSTITLYCENIEEAGLVSCHIQTDEKVWNKFIITAFGKPQELSKEQLNKLHGFPLNSLKISHGPFLEKLGDYTVSLSFKRYYYKQDSTKPVTEKVTVFVQKNKIQILGPLSNQQTIRIPVKE